jgi:secretion/DNA translocation related TadE-like protein
VTPQDRARDDVATSDHRGDDDSGVATVWAAGAVSVLMVILVFGLHLAAATSGRHRAEAAADLGALAAASHALDGEPVACAYAARVVRRMTARLVSCRVVGWDALVETTATTALAPPGIGEAHGRARAGPAQG